MWTNRLARGEQLTAVVSNQALFAIQLYNKLFVDRQLDVFPLGQRQNAALVIIAIDLQPRGSVLVAGKILCQLQNAHLPATLTYRDLLAGADLIRRNIHLPSIDEHMAMAHELTRLPARDPESRAINNAVQAALKLLQEHCAGHASGAGGLLEI